MPYPAEGEGDAAVLLEIVVAEDGTVSEAKVLEGVEPIRHAGDQRGPGLELHAGVAGSRTHPGANPGAN